MPKSSANKQQRRFPLLTLDLLLGTLDGSSEHGTIWFNPLHITQVSSGEKNSSSLSLITMRDGSQWIAPRKPLNFNRYVEEITAKYRVYTEAVAILVESCQKEWCIESRFDTPYLRKLYTKVFFQPAVYDPFEFIACYCQKRLEHVGATVLFPEQEIGN